MKKGLALRVLFAAIALFLFPHGLSAAAQTVELKIATCD